MKKIFSSLLALICAALLCVTVFGCTDKNEGATLNIYCPDGAPALSLASLTDDEAYKVNVVEASLINTYVSGENPAADVCVMPVNAAVKMFHSGEKYRCAGVVTHGNLFLLKKEGQENIIGTQSLSALVGKTVGVVNLANVPGLTFKVILQSADVPFVELKDGATPSQDGVNLLSVTNAQVLPAGNSCDYFVVSEPFASTKVDATNGKLSFAGSLQTLYGGENGYPQAVLMVKTSVLEQNKSEMDGLLQKLSQAENFLKTTGAEELVTRVKGAFLKADATPMFTAKNLTAEVVSNCSVRFESSQSCKQAVEGFMQKFNAVSATPWGTPSAQFFC